MIIKPKNWHEFQHYKNRCPPWIKLHRTILDNYEFHKLPDASKALAMCLWLLASEGDEGEIDANYEKLAFRFRSTEKKIEESLKPLIDEHFFYVVRDASTPIADSEQDALLEESRERVEKEKRERKITLAQFMKNCDEKGEMYISNGDPIFIWADEAKVPQHFMDISWAAFIKKTASKKQLDWRQTYRNYVQLDYLKVWSINKDGEYYLTTFGKMIALELGVNG